MTKTILVMMLNKRKETAVNVQKILTEWGCLIKTRLGIHDGVLDDCSNTGLIMLELVGDEEKINEMTRKLKLLNGVSLELVKLTLEN